MVALLALSLALPISFVWVLACNERTYRQRILLIDAISEAGRASNFEADYWPAFHSVSYERHMWLLIAFRNPWKEYAGLPPGFPRVAAR